MICRRAVLGCVCRYAAARYCTVYAGHIGGGTAACMCGGHTSSGTDLHMQKPIGGDSALRMPGISAYV
eukprot:3769260-Rhodomonas_salina.1